MIHSSPLAGLRILDASRILAGPYCAQLLGDLGADVIKIERPGEGDDTRGWGPPFHDTFSAYFLSCNRNKRSLTLDLNREEGQKLFRHLLGKSDVLIENFRTDSLSKLGLRPLELLKQDPHLVICSISGYGRTGPMKDVLGYDFAIQALSGLMSITGEPQGAPMKVGVALTDVLTGLHAAVAILACLRARESSRHGYAIDLSLLDCAVASQVNLAQAYLTSDTVPARQGNAHLQIVPYQLFATQDGWIVVNVGNDRQWQHLCEAMETPTLAGDERFATNQLRVQNRLILVPELESLMKGRSTAGWVERFERHHVPHAVVQDYRRLFEQEVTQARGMKQTILDPQGKPVDLLGSPFHLDGATLPETRFPPQLGQHSREILRDLLGLDDATLEQLAGEKII
jgi:crotonobetainyl-CoA:carnitine CoA-transferase CaiB-like acyl-CoA transferase